MAQWCSDASYVEDLKRRCFAAPHVRPLNLLVDELRAVYPDRFVPYVAPTFGGTNARLLSLFPSPGPATLPATGGSGMLCIENDDPMSARHKALLSEYKVDVCDVVTWNAYPWFGSQWFDDKNFRTKRNEISAMRALSRFLSLLPNLEVVMIHGTVARKAWVKLTEYTPVEFSYAPRVEPGAVHTSRLPTIETWHTSPAVVDPRHRTSAEIVRFTRELHEAFGEAAAILRKPDKWYMDRDGDAPPF